MAAATMPMLNLVIPGLVVVSTFVWKGQAELLATVSDLLPTDHPHRVQVSDYVERFGFHKLYERPAREGATFGTATASCWRLDPW